MLYLQLQIFNGSFHEFPLLLRVVFVSSSSPSSPSSPPPSSSSSSSSSFRRYNLIFLLFWPSQHKISAYCDPECS
jgi:hypothetical protein